MIVSGIQEGLTIAARLFLTRGALSLIEDPCYEGAALAFETAGAEVVSIDVDQDGLDPDCLPKRTASLLYATPSHQYPTGAMLSAERRAELIKWARRYGCYIVEDDYDCDIRYQGSHLPPLAALAPDCNHLYGDFFQIPRRRITPQLHGRAGAHCRSRPHRKIPYQQRQSLAGAGDTRRLHAQRQLCRPSSPRPPLIIKPAATV